MDVNGITAVVTGGASGLGAATARALAAVKEADAGKRIAEYEAMQRDVMARGPFAIMLQEIGIAALRRPLSGFRQGPLSDRTSYAPIAKG